MDLIEKDASNISYIVACIRCRGNAFTEPLPSNDKGIHIETHRLMGEIYEVRRGDGFRCIDIHRKFHEDWLRHSEFDSGGAKTVRGEYREICLFSNICKGVPGTRGRKAASSPVSVRGHF
jgi:hypothetical protein